MRGRGTIAPAAPPLVAPPDQIFEEFGGYLHNERGLTPKFIVRHLPVIRRFLGKVCPAGASDLGGISQRPSSATSSVMPGIGVPGQGRRCAGRRARFSDTSITVG
jgi:hypothetical protein